MQSEGSAGDLRSKGFVHEKAYVRKIERRFVALRQSGLLVSPRDFALLLDWHNRGVPAALVIETIENLFARSASRSQSRTIQSIAYCRNAVEEAWEERRAALLGPPAVGSETTGGALTAEEVAQHLDAGAAQTLAAAEALGSPPERFAAQGTLAKCRSGLVAISRRLLEIRETLRLEPSVNLPALEDDLAALERRAIVLARSALSPDQLAALTRNAEESLAPFATRMSERARTATLRRAVEGAIRREMNLPRYSLFALLR